MRHLDSFARLTQAWATTSPISLCHPLSVVINIWDQRTLIVPLSFFIEQPFTNWMRTGSEILGTAFLYLDYSVPVESLRAELQRIVEPSPLWDKRVCGLQVTNLSEHTMEIRCLVSARDSGKSFDLRCLIREKMIEFVRENHPRAFPTMRIESHREAMQRQPENEPGPLPPPVLRPDNKVPNPLESTGAAS